MQKRSNEDEKIAVDEKLKPLIFAIILIIMIWSFSYLLILFLIPLETNRGTFGDSFGAINSLFSGLAFAGIIYTIFLQRKELSLQRLELMETRKELKRSADAQEKSEIALTEQIKSMKLTAKLNALNSLVENYRKEEEKYRLKDSRISIAMKEKKEIYLKEIETTLEKLE